MNAPTDLTNPTNSELADLLDKLADLLAEDGAPERSNAWSSAAWAVRHLGRSVAELVLVDGPDALAAVPGVNSGLALIISAMLENAEQPLAMAC